MLRVSQGRICSDNLTCCQTEKLLIKLSTSPSHSIPTPGRPVKDPRMKIVLFGYFFLKDYIRETYYRRHHQHHHHRRRRHQYHHHHYHYHHYISASNPVYSVLFYPSAHSVIFVCFFVCMVCLLFSFLFFLFFVGFVGLFISSDLLLLFVCFFLSFPFACPAENVCELEILAEL